MPNPKEQLELLTAYQQKFERLLQARTGLTVRVSLAVHSNGNPEADLLQLFEAGIVTSDFEPQSTSRKTWIAHTDPSKNICIFMPDGFDADELYPEPEDLEGYNLAVEVSNATKQEVSSEETEDDGGYGQRLFEGRLGTTAADDEIPF